MVIDASALFSAKIVANNLQSNIGNDYKVIVEYSCDPEEKFNWYNIEFSLFEKETGIHHEIPINDLSFSCNDNFSGC